MIFKIKQNQVHLLRPLLTASAAALVSRLDVTIESEFRLVHDAIDLHEFKLSSSQLHSRFSTLVSRNRDKALAVYSNQLKLLLVYYLENRFCSDFQTKINFVTCNRIIKQSLPSQFCVLCCHKRVAVKIIGCL